MLDKSVKKKKYDIKKRNVTNYTIQNAISLQVKHCRLPSLAVALTLHHCHETSDVSKAGDACEGLSDVVGFVIGLLLGSDQDVRYWFAQFIRNGQKVIWLDPLLFFFLLICLVY